MPKCLTPTQQMRQIEGFLSPMGFKLSHVPGVRGFLPGLKVCGTIIEVDLASLLSPGEILHEAGHVAIIPSVFRDQIGEDVDASLFVLLEAYKATHPAMISTAAGLEHEPVMWAAIHAGEQEAQAWSYAAALVCGVPASSVFHRKAYEGRGSGIAFALSIKQHAGIHGMQAAGMTTKAVFPKMTRWLQA